MRLLLRTIIAPLLFLSFLSLARLSYLSRTRRHSTLRRCVDATLVDLNREAGDLPYSQEGHEEPTTRAALSDALICTAGESCARSTLASDVNLSECLMHTHGAYGRRSYETSGRYHKGVELRVLHTYVRSTRASESCADSVRLGTNPRAWHSLHVLTYIHGEQTDPSKDIARDPEAQ